MDLLIGLMCIAGGAIVGLFFGDFRANEKINALRDQLDAAKSKKGSNKPSKKKGSKAKKSDTAEPNDSKALESAKSALADAKEELKKAKTQVYDLKGENKSLRAEVKESKSSKKGSSKKDAEQLFALREEVGDLKAQIANLETTAKAKKSAPVEDKPAEIEVKTNADGGISEETLREIREQHRAEIKSLKEKNKEELSDLKRKLKKASSNVDKQRRRADNTDKAYKINQRQIDALQDRIKLLEQGVPAYTPEPLAVQSPTATPRKTVQLDPADLEKKTRKPSDDKPAETAAKPPVEDVDGAPPSVIAASPDPLTLEMSPDIADELMNEAVQKSEVQEEVGQTSSSVTTTAMLTPSKMAGGFEEEITPPKSVDDAWAEFDVD